MKLPFLSIQKIISEEYFGATENGHFEKQESRAVAALDLGLKLIKKSCQKSGSILLTGRCE